MNFQPQQDFFQIARDQNSLGWFATLMVLFHKSLIVYQHDYYKGKDSLLLGENNSHANCGTYCIKFGHTGILVYMIPLQPMK